MSEETDNRKPEAERRLAPVSLLDAVARLHTKWMEKHVDETVQWAFNEFSTEAHKQIVEPISEVLEEYEKWQASNAEISGADSPKL